MIWTHDLCDSGAYIWTTGKGMKTWLLTVPVSKRSWVRIPFKPEFSFRALISNCWSCVHNCDDQSCLHLFLRSSNIWYFIYSFAFFTIYGYIRNSQNDQLPVGSIAQLVEHCTGIAEVVGSNPVQALIISKALNSQLLKLCVYCDDQSYVFITCES